jgi:hypothetical protein
MWQLGLWPHNSLSGNICFEFTVLVLCSEGGPTRRWERKKNAMKEGREHTYNVHACRQGMKSEVKV